MCQLVIPIFSNPTHHLITSSVLVMKGGVLDHRRFFGVFNSSSIMWWLALVGWRFFSGHMKVYWHVPMILHILVDHQIMVGRWLELLKVHVNTSNLLLSRIQWTSDRHGNSPQDNTMGPTCELCLGSWVIGNFQFINRFINNSTAWRT